MSVKKQAIIEINNDTSKIVQIRYITDGAISSQAKIPFELSKEIFEELSYTPRSAIWSPKYKMGRWSGKLYLGNYKTQEFPTGLYNRVSKILKDNGFEIIIRDLRIKPLPNKKWAFCKRRWDRPDDNIEERYYQEEARNIAVKVGRGVLSCPTGSGKTTIFSKIIAQLQVSPVIVFVPTKTLLTQTQKEIEAMIDDEGYPITVGVIGDMKVDIRDITVCIIDSALSAFNLRFDEKTQKVVEVKDTKKAGKTQSPVQARKEEIQKLIRSALIIVADESHLAASEKWKAVLQRCDSAYYRIAVSATPFRDDGKELEIEAIFGRILFQITLRQLIDEGYLMDPEIYMMTIYYDPEGAELTREITVIKDDGEIINEQCVQWVSVEDWNYNDFYEQIVVKNEEWNNKIAALVEKFNAEGLSVLVLVSRIEHGEILQEKIPSAVFLQGEDSRKVRDAAISQIKNKEILTIIATTIADMGLDLPSLDVLFLAGGGGSDPTKNDTAKKSITKSATLQKWLKSSENKFDFDTQENETYDVQFGGRIQQRLGRVLRKHRDKKRAIVIDAMFVNRVMKKQSLTRKKIFTDLGLKVKVIK